MSATEVKKCNNPRCYHPWQDREYNGKRVHNQTKDGKWRCVVCLTVRE